MVLFPEPKSNQDSHFFFINDSQGHSKLIADVQTKVF
jgi:hypothetical protein